MLECSSHKLLLFKTVVSSNINIFPWEVATHYNSKNIPVLTHLNVFSSFSPRNSRYRNVRQMFCHYLAGVSTVLRWQTRRADGVVYKKRFARRAGKLWAESVGGTTCLPNTRAKHRRWSQSYHNKSGVTGAVFMNN